MDTRPRIELANGTVIHGSNDPEKFRGWDNINMLTLWLTDEEAAEMGLPAVVEPMPTKPDEGDAQ